MVTEYGPQSVRRVHLAQELGARFSGSGGSGGGAKVGYGNEVSGKHDQFGMEVIDHADRRVQGMDRKYGVVMKIAEQRDGETVKFGGPAAQRDFAANDAGTIGLEQDGIRGQSGHAGAGGKTDKLSPGNGKKSQSLSGPYAAGLRGTQVSAFRITRVQRSLI